MHMLPLSSLSLMKYRSISTCLVWSCWKELLTILVAALLSQKKFNSVSYSWWRSDRTSLSQIFSHIHKLMARYSTSALLLATNPFLLTPPSYKIAPIKGTINKGRLSINNRSCPVQAYVCLNGLSVYLSKHQPLTMCCFQVSQNSVDNFHVFLIGSMHKLADNTHNKENIRTSMDK